MNFAHNSRRAVAIVMLAAISAAILAPAASADHGRRYKGRSRVVYAPPMVHRTYVSPRVYHRDSGAAPLLAGFIGGLILGATVSHAAPPPDYYYYDPYCHERFASLEIYREHVWRHEHPRVVRVIEVGSGDCAYSYRYDSGAWHRCGSDRDYGYDGGYRGHDDGYRGQYDDRGYEDDDQGDYRDR